MTTSIEDIIRRIVREELERALASKQEPPEEKPDPLIAGRRRMLTIDQVAELCGISKKTIYGLRAQTNPGAFAPAQKIGGKLRWRPEDVEAWLDGKLERPPARRPLELRRP